MKSNSAPSCSLQIVISFWLESTVLSDDYFTSDKVLQIWLPNVDLKVAYVYQVLWNWRRKLTETTVSKKGSASS